MIINITIIRHGKTCGNEKKQYIGKTDEDLSDSGYSEVKKLYGKMHTPDCVFSSPMKRCAQTSALLFETVTPVFIDEIKETDFGIFERKTYEELKNTESYKLWLDTGGESDSHEGEKVSDFKTRCIKGFNRIIDICLEKGYSDIAVVAHGGTIMALLDKFSSPHKDFYNWQTQNASGFSFLFDTEKNIAYDIVKIQP